MSVSPVSCRAGISSGSSAWRRSCVISLEPDCLPSALPCFSARTRRKILVATATPTDITPRTRIGCQAWLGPRAGRQVVAERSKSGQGAACPGAARSRPPRWPCSGQTTASSRTRNRASSEAALQWPVAAHRMDSIRPLCGRRVPQELPRRPCHQTSGASVSPGTAVETSGSGCRFGRGTAEGGEVDAPSANRS